MKADAIKLRAAMFEKQLTQRKISQITGISRNTINTICTGKTCGFDALSKVARVLEMDPRDLILIEEEQNEQAERTAINS